MTQFPSFSSPCQNGVAHPFHFTQSHHNKGATERDKRCAICYEDFLDNDCTTSHCICHSVFHTSCLDLYAVHKAKLGVSDYNGFTVDTTRRDQFLDRKNVADDSCRPGDPIDDLRQELRWVEMLRDGVLIRCPVCQHYLQAFVDRSVLEVPEYVSPFRIAEDLNVCDLIQSIQNATNVMPVPRQLVLEQSRYWQLDPKFRTFYHRHVLHQSDGMRPRFDLPNFDPEDQSCAICASSRCSCGLVSPGGAFDGPSRFNPFLGARVTEAAVYMITARPNEFSMERGRRSSIVLLTPQQNYIFLTALSRIGRSPALPPSCRITNLSSLRGSPFHEIVRAAYGMGACRITSPQFEILCPDFAPLRNFTVLHVEIMGMVNGRIHIEVAVGEWSKLWHGPPIFDSISEGYVSSTLRLLGGVQPDIVLSLPHADNLRLLSGFYKTWASVNMPFGDLSLRTFRVSNNTEPVDYDLDIMGFGGDDPMDETDDEAVNHARHMSVADSDAKMID